MRFLDYGIAWIVEGIFFLVILGLVIATIGNIVEARRQHFSLRRWMELRGYISDRPRHGWLEELRARHHRQNLDRLARKIERKLERRRSGWPWDLG